jgi:hypothetical protein
MKSIEKKILELNKERNKFLKKYDKSWDENIFDYNIKQPKEIDEIGNQIRNIIIEEQDNLSVEFIIESLTKLGEAPSILYDDNGHFAVTGDGYQSLPSDDFPKDDISMSFYVEKKKWFRTIRKALKNYLEED